MPSGYDAGKLKGFGMEIMCSGMPCVQEVFVPASPPNYTEPFASLNDSVSGLCGMVIFVRNGNRQNYITSALREWRRARGAVRGPPSPLNPSCVSCFRFWSRKRLRERRKQHSIALLLHL